LRYKSTEDEPSAIRAEKTDDEGPNREAVKNEEKVSADERSAGKEDEPDGGEVGCHKEAIDQG
jgi:hypothetical protein